MNSNAALQAADQRDGAGEPEGHEDVKAFLDALAALVRDTVSRFEDTVGRVTGMIMPGGARRADRDMIVTLQNFDRLQQEFAALGEALARYAAETNRLKASGKGHREVGNEVVAAICMADLKERFIRHLGGDQADAGVGDEAIF
jgi:hypothetical protein